MYKNNFKFIIKSAFISSLIMSTFVVSALIVDTKSKSANKELGLIKELSRLHLTNYAGPVGYVESKDGHKYTAALCYQQNLVYLIAPADALAQNQPNETFHLNGDNSRIVSWQVTSLGKDHQFDQNNKRYLLWKGVLQNPLNVSPLLQATSGNYSENITVSQYGRLRFKNQETDEGMYAGQYAEETGTVPDVICSVENDERGWGSVLTYRDKENNKYLLGFVICPKGRVAIHRMVSYKNFDHIRNMLFKNRNQN